ncbi:MAG: rod shape-determining protein, partial [Planctomycetes bacterium]|nr:rod shape-determining protein [Planctomycetota bacterium]
MDDAKKTKVKAPPKDTETESVEQEKGVLYVGIDLGTSRTSIASSNGVRESTYSVVGYPKDVVSRKLLKREVLYGEDAIANRLSLKFYRPLEKGVIKGSDGNGSFSEQEAEMNMNAARDLVKHAIKLARPRSDELIYGVIGCPAQSSIKNKSYLVEAAREVLDSVMICSEPFAVAYGMDWFTDLLVIDIGAGTVDLCRMHGTLPEEDDQITLATAGDFIDKELARRITKTYPEAQYSDNMIKTIKERHATVVEDAPPIFVEFPVQGKPQRFDITKEMKGACQAIIPPIVDSLGKLIATFDPEFQTRLKDNVLLGGGGSQIYGLAEAIQKEMCDRLGHGRV